MCFEVNFFLEHCFARHIGNSANNDASWLATSVSVDCGDHARELHWCLQRCEEVKESKRLVYSIFNGLYFNVSEIAAKCVSAYSVSR